MASTRKVLQEESRLRVMQIIKHNSHVTSRKIAKEVGISNGSAYYLLISLIDNGFIKLLNVKEHSNNIRYSYFLTSKGIREKSILTHKFLLYKKDQYETLKNEIRQLEQEVGNK